MWQKRIGALLPGGEDLWWDAEADGDVGELADAVIWALQDYALPSMHRQMK